MTAGLERIEKESWEEFLKFLATDITKKAEGIAITYLESEQELKKTREINKPVESKPAEKKV